MNRAVSCRIRADVGGAGDIVFYVAVARGYTRTSEALLITLDGDEVDAVEHDDEYGSRLHRISLTRSGTLDLSYRATVGDSAPQHASTVETIRFARPSRYCESDRLVAFARSEFAGVDGPDLLNAVRNWVNARLSYVSGSSRGTDGAVQTLLAGEGVCRDFAHLVCALLRACEIPARVVSVYAPGLDPMDFHAVAEAAIDGEWFVLDATGLAPRAAMVRIATGRDAADTAFMTTRGGPIELTDMEVVATVEGAFPTDDPTRHVRIT